MSKIVFLQLIRPTPHTSLWLTSPTTRFTIAKTWEVAALHGVPSNCDLRELFSKLTTKVFRPVDGCFDFHIRDLETGELIAKPMTKAGVKKALMDMGYDAFPRALSDTEPSTEASIMEKEFAAYLVYDDDGRGAWEDINQINLHCI